MHAEAGTAQAAGSVQIGRSQVNYTHKEDGQDAAWRTKNGAISHPLLNEGKCIREYSKFRPIEYFCFKSFPCLLEISLILEYSRMHFPSLSSGCEIAPFFVRYMGKTYFKRLCSNASQAKRPAASRGPSPQRRPPDQSRWRIIPSAATPTPFLTVRSAAAGHRTAQTGPAVSTSLITRRPKMPYGTGLSSSVLAC
jgi:hypothetical protein